MSYSSRGNGVASSSRRYHDSIATDESSGAVASLSSQLEMYNSELASSSQPSTDNNFHGDRTQYPLSHNKHNGSEEEQLHRYPTEQTHTFVPRSTPIAIKRTTHGDGKKDIDESEPDEEEDDDSEIDVEGDAIKLRRKYGNKVIQTYNEESTILRASDTRLRERGSVLNAPYLGSLSKSSNQVLSLPPMSLTGDDSFGGDPPESIMSYGSLRDSHERGRFLDGPASYREPMSGKIHHLDHRLRYHGRQPELNIGERLQQSRKLKELREKESKKLKERSSDSDTQNSATDGGENKGQKPATSSLSAIMADAPQTADTVNKGFQDGYSRIGSESLVPLHTGTNMSQGLEHGSSMHSSPRVMLSTSLTAFELLTTSNTKSPPYTSDQQDSTTLDVTSSYQKIDFRSQTGFQPLARSMSDPTPGFQNLSLSQTTSSRIFPTLQTEGVPMSPLTTQRMNIFDGTGIRSPNQDHDPNTDGAFGDMDL